MSNIGSNLRMGESKDSLQQALKLFLKNLRN